MSDTNSAAILYQKSMCEDLRCSDSPRLELSSAPSSHGIQGALHVNEVNPLFAQSMPCFGPVTSASAPYMFFHCRVLLPSTNNLPKLSRGPDPETQKMQETEQSTLFAQSRTCLEQQSKVPLKLIRPKLPQKSPFDTTLYFTQRVSRFFPNISHNTSSEVSSSTFSPASQYLASSQQLMPVLESKMDNDSVGVTDTNIPSSLTDAESTNPITGHKISAIVTDMERNSLTDNAMTRDITEMERSSSVISTDLATQLTDGQNRQALPERFFNGVGMFDHGALPIRTKGSLPYHDELLASENGKSADGDRDQPDDAMACEANATSFIDRSLSNHKLAMDNPKLQKTLNAIVSKAFGMTIPEWKGTANFKKGEDDFYQSVLDRLLNAPGVASDPRPLQVSMASTGGTGGNWYPPKSSTRKPRDWMSPDEASKFLGSQYEGPGRAVLKDGRLEPVLIEDRLFDSDTSSLEFILLRQRMEFNRKQEQGSWLGRMWKHCKKQLKKVLPKNRKE